MGSYTSPDRLTFAMMKLTPTLLVLSIRKKRKSSLMRNVCNGHVGLCGQCGNTVETGMIRFGEIVHISCMIHKTRQRHSQLIQDSTESCSSCNRESCDCIALSNDEKDDAIKSVRDSIRSCFGIFIPLENEDENVPIRLIPHKSSGLRNDSDGTSTAYTNMRYSRHFQFFPFPPKTFLRLDRVSEICLTKDLEIGHSLKILVHELFHVWLRRCNDIQDLKEEEAFCEMMAYLWLAEVRASLMKNRKMKQSSSFLRSDLLSRISIHAVNAQLEFVEKRRNGPYGSCTIEKWLEIARRKTLPVLLEDIVESSKAVCSLQDGGCKFKF